MGQNQSRFQKSVKPRCCCCSCWTFCSGGPLTKIRNLNHGSESGTYIDLLDSSNPTAVVDSLAQADDHLRLIKATIKASFPNISGAMTATHTELSVIDGDTAATSTTLVDADRTVINDDGTMKQVAMSDVMTYVNAGMTLRDDVVTTASIADNAVVTASIADGAVTAAKAGHRRCLLSAAW